MAYVCACVRVCAYAVMHWCVYVCVCVCVCVCVHACVRGCVGGCGLKRFGASLGLINLFSVHINYMHCNWVLLCDRQLKYSWSSLSLDPAHKVW